MYRMHNACGIERLCVLCKCVQLSEEIKIFEAIHRTSQKQIKRTFRLFLTLFYTMRYSKFH